MLSPLPSDAGPGPLLCDSSPCILAAPRVHRFGIGCPGACSWSVVEARSEPCSVAVRPCSLPFRPSVVGITAGAGAVAEAATAALLGGRHPLGPALCPRATPTVGVVLQTRKLRSERGGAGTRTLSAGSPAPHTLNPVGLSAVPSGLQCRPGPILKLGFWHPGQGPACSWPAAPSSPGAPRHVLWQNQRGRGKPGRLSPPS